MKPILVLKKVKYITKEFILLILVYLFIFISCISQDAIYSFDTYDYLMAMPYRQLGYVIFVKVFEFVFGSYFDISVVIFQTMFSLFGVNYFFNIVSRLFKLKIVAKLTLLAILIFPFFHPLSIANNICSEGLSYGIYLLFIALGLDILFNSKNKQIKYFALLYFALVFVRGQFFFITIIFAFLYYLVNKKQISNKKHLINLVILFTIPLIASLAERSYHKLKDGFFKPTPLGFVSASTAPFYLSSKDDIDLIENENYKAIFELSYDQLETKGLLLSSKNNAENAYLFFHDNLPKICNQTVHASGKAYFQDKNPPTPNNPKLAVARAYFDIEAACKNITLTLIKENFNDWISLYYANISYGFYSPILLFFVLGMLVFSLIKTVFNYKKHYAIIFLLSSLILSNAMFIAFASHSIMRYLFYNYALLFLLFISTINNLIKRERNS